MSRVERRKRVPLWKRILIGLMILVLVLVAAAAGLVLWLSVTEYKPDAEEVLAVATTQELAENGKAYQPKAGQTLTVMTWNVGYGALGDDADFFMDGGTSVRAETEERVGENLTGITSALKGANADIVLLQEVDKDASRSYHIDEEAWIRAGFEPGATCATFAYNYMTPFVPYPMPPLGKIEAGLLTISKLPIESATRVQLPVPFSWPVRTVNLKRCLAVNRIPVTGSKKELVIVNLHLEAYDDGEGKAAQTAMLNDFLQAEAEKGNYVIAGGDFNQKFSGTDSSAYPYQEGLWECGLLEEEDFADGWQFIMDNKVPSCRSLDRAYAGADKENFQYYLIDGFIVSKNVEVLDYATQNLGFVVSDHNPVLMRVKLK